MSLKMNSKETLIKYKKYLQLEIDIKRLNERLASLSDTERDEKMNELFETDFNRFETIHILLKYFFFKKHPEKEAEYIRRTPFPSNSEIKNIKKQLLQSLAVYTDFCSSERKLYDEARAGKEQNENPDFGLIDVFQDQKDGQITIGISNSENKYDIQFTNNELSKENEELFLSETYDH